MRSYTRQELLDKLTEITNMIGKVPTQRELREYGISEDPYYREFGNWSNAKGVFMQDGGFVHPPVEPLGVSPITETRTTVDKLLEQLKNNLSEEELKAVVRSTGVTSVKPKLKHTSHETGHFKMLVMSDTHIGHSKFREDWWHHMVDTAVKEKVDFAYHAGDILEGMSGRGGHVYELDCIGFEAQFAKAKRLIADCPFQVRGIIGNHDCLSEDTEVLTNRGWKHYTELLTSDLILSYDKGTCVWDTITEVVSKEVSEDLVHIVNHHVDMLVTKGHRVLHSKRKQSTLEFEEQTYKAADDLSGRIAIPTGASFNVSKARMLDDEIRLLAWVLTDGACKDGVCNIYQSKDLSKIHDILRRLRIDYTTYTRHRDITQICGTELVGEPLPENNIKFKYGLPDKYPFPEVCFEFNDQQFEVFLQSLIDGDGSRYKDRPTTYILYGTKDFLSNVQTLCIMHGYRAVVAEDNRGTFRLNISKKLTSQFEVSSLKKYVNYTGTVWCLVVPKTNFMVRRNGKAFFTGNCWFTGKADQGINAGLRLEESLSNFVYLGSMEADQVVENVKIKLFHGNDGGSYAISYRGQKIVESLDGGDKPHILITGHDHKSVFFQTRNVHVIGAGTLCEQTSFMRGKKLAAHRGYWIVDVWSNEQGLVRIRPEWHPFY